jgi:hypothetical protein
MTSGKCWRIIKQILWNKMSECDIDTCTSGYSPVAVSFDSVQELRFSRQMKKYAG